MSKFKGTPGPWHVANGCQIRSAKDQIAKAWMMRDGEGQANARLIAAAPELLEALNLVLDNCLDSGGLAAAHAKARAAIAKATGDNP